MNAWRVAVRADAGPVIGSGHVMRGLTLAAALRDRGATVCFLCADGTGHLGDRIQGAGFGLQRLPAGLAEADDAAATQAALRAAFGAAGCDLLVVDHYGLGVAWESMLRPACRSIAAIDDLADRPHDVDLLLDQNLGRQALEYSRLLPPHARRLIGPAFALLRPEFAAARSASLARRAGIGRWRHLLVSLGGGDPQQATLQVVHALARCALPADASVTVVLGALAASRDAVAAALPALPCATRLLVDVTDMAALLAEADLAIGAAGGSAWERCCLGLPSLLLVLASNQRPGTQALAAAGAALPLAGVDDLPAALDHLAAPGRLAAMSAAAAAVTDGLGAARVAEALCALPG